MLVKSGFDVEKKWSKLIALIGVSLDERRRLQTMVTNDHDYHFILEEGIQWWIDNGTNVSWNELVSAIENCGDCNIATKIKREIDIGKFNNIDCVIYHVIYVDIPHSSSELLQVNSSKICDNISSVLYKVTDALYAKQLISLQTKEEMLVMGVMTDYTKASKLMSVLQRQLEVHSDPDQYLVNICNVLINQQQQTLTDIAISILQQLGQFVVYIIINYYSLIFHISGQTIPDHPTYSGTPDQPTYSGTSTYLIEILNFFQSLFKKILNTSDWSLQECCQIIKDKFKIYKNESEWPVLRCGEEYFGRLSLVDRNAQNNKQWSITRGDNDIISQVHSKMEIEDVLKPNDSDQSLTVVVDGPPGIGKTTLCRKLLNLWANGELKHKQYDLVLYCPLRNINIAQANKLEQLLNYNYQCPDVFIVTEWIEREHGKGLLIIFDGWDELSTQLRQSSLPTKIICKQLLHKCSVIVTSRSYASSSLLKLTSVNKHVQVMGFLEEEIKTVIKRTLENNPQIAQELIDELQIRNDVYTLCYIPLICSIVIHVFEVNGQLPTTLTKLYENFILQAIRRYVANTGHYGPEDIQSLNEKHLPSNIATSFKEMCQFAYESLKENNPKMTFSSIEIQQHLKQTGYLGLIRNYDKDVYQFLHLSIQEFLAAWWIAKYNEKTEEIFNAHFDDDHFRMCLRFVLNLNMRRTINNISTKNLTYNVRRDHCLDLMFVVTQDFIKIQILH